MLISLNAHDVQKVYLFINNYLINSEQQLKAFKRYAGI